MRYINQTNVRKLVNMHGKRVSREFLLHLDIFIETKIKKACAVHNGGKITLDADIANYIGIR